MPSSRLLFLLMIFTAGVSGYQDSSSVTPTNLPAWGVKRTRNWDVVTVGNVTSLASLATGAAGLFVWFGTFTHEPLFRYCTV